jgi:hypothetical protein
MVTKLELPMPGVATAQQTGSSGAIKRPRTVVELPVVATQPPPLEKVVKTPLIAPTKISDRNQAYWDRDYESIASLGEDGGEENDEAENEEPLQTASDDLSEGETSWLPRRVEVVPQTPLKAPKSIPSINSLFAPEMLDEEDGWKPTLPSIRPGAQAVLPTIQRAVLPTAEGNSYVVTRKLFHDNKELESLTIIRVFLDWEVPKVSMIIWFENWIRNHFESTDAGMLQDRAWNEDPCELENCELDDDNVILRMEVLSNGAQYEVLRIALGDPVEVSLL